MARKWQSSFITIPKGELARFSRAMRIKADKMGENINDVITQQSRLMALDLVNATPPTKAHRANLGTGAFRNPAPQMQRKQGLNAVKMDNKRLFQPLRSIDMVRDVLNTPGKNAFKTMVRAGQYDDLAHTIHVMGLLPFKPKIIKDASKEFLNKWRDKRGRVFRRVKNPFLVVNGSSIKTVLKEQQAKVGLLKSGWVNALKLMGLSVPGWIAKGGKGEASKSRNPFKLSYVFHNQIAYGQKHYDYIVKRVLKHRVESMIKQARGAVKSTLKKEMAR